MIITLRVVLHINEVHRTPLDLHVADNVVVFTATPINKGLTDLLPIIDVLGADNLDDETLNQFDRLLRRSKGPIDVSEEQLEPLRKEVQKFTVRRTKAMFNELIDREPSLYTDVSGRECRYPDHLPQTYELNESTKDIDLAEEIQELAGHHQVFCITHLPQIAARGDLHFQVSKQVEDGRTQSSVTRLYNNSRVEELARMLAGDSATEQTQAWARELLVKGSGAV